MYVTRIEIAGFKAPAREGLYQGTVTLEADGQRMLIPLALAKPVRPDLGRHRLLLIAHALRRARRLPEYRKRGAMRFAPGLLPEELRGICA